MAALTAALALKTSATPGVTIMSRYLQLHTNMNPLDCLPQ